MVYEVSESDKVFLGSFLVHLFQRTKSDPDISAGHSTLG